MWATRFFLPNPTARTGGFSECSVLSQKGGSKPFWLPLANGEGMAAAIPANDNTRPGRRRRFGLPAAIVLGSLILAANVRSLYFIVERLFP